MALVTKGKFSYGDAQSDIRDELLDYSTRNTYIAEHFADAVCQCGGRIFNVLLDDDEGAVVRTCTTCKDEHPIDDITDYLEDAELQECGCPCGESTFEVTVGVALYPESEDVKWLYLGLRCVATVLHTVPPSRRRGRLP